MYLKLILAFGSVFIWIVILQEIFSKNMFTFVYIYIVPSSSFGKPSYNFDNTYNYILSIIVNKNMLITNDI